MLKHLAIIFVSSFTLVLYQNCAPQKQLQKPGSGSGSEVVVASTQDVAKVEYDPNLESQAPSVPMLLSVDLNSGQASLRANDGSVKSCAVDATRLQSLVEIMASGKVCEPKRDPNVAYCMAIGVADVKLEESDSDSTMLRPVICNNGQYLCDGQDQVFRSILESLVSNPPPGCN